MSAADTPALEGDSGNGFDRPAPSRDAADRFPGLAVAGMASIGAGAIHAGAIGIHAEHPQLARLFIAVALFQLGWGIWALMRPSRLLGIVGVVGNTVAVAGWVATRVAGISWIDGLEVRESPQFTDTAAAVLALVAAGAALAAVLVGRKALPNLRIALPALAVAAITVPAMWAGSNHVHAEGHDHTATASGVVDESQPHDHTATGTIGTTGATGVVDESQPHDHTASGESVALVDESQPHDHTATDAAAVWPRPFDPTQPIDLSGVPGVTAEQEQRATDVLTSTMDVLPKFADTKTAFDLGYRSIGDAGTGFEHYVNYQYIGDDHFMDPEYPESLVYRADGDARTLVSAMYIAKDMPIDSPELVDFAGPLMQWHVHDNLCWALDENGTPRVVGLVDEQGNCPGLSVNAGGGNPMVHVWIAAHECGPFAALEGHGAGQTDPNTGVRTDQCSHDHTHSGTTTDASAAAEAKPYDPTMPIDLSGMPGVTPQQQARAENLIAVTLLRLPKYADTADAEADGFRTIGDGFVGGYEHYMNWSYINDDKVLDPDHPESLVYQHNADGTKTLVSAMYMTPDGVTLDDVPDVGGALTQWHIHNNLCFSNDPTETGQAFVIGITNAEGGCSIGVKLQENPMLHVWIVPNKCGPFAALDGVGAGQIKEGEERLCDHAHGAH